MRTLVAGVMLLMAPLAASQPEERTWSELASLVNRQIRMTMPQGTVIEGTLTAVETDGLVLQIRSTTDKKAYPRGRFVAPRAEVKTLDVLSKGRKFRVIGTIVGAWAGLALGIYAGAHMDSAGPALAVFGVIGGGLTTAGYVIGDSADTQTRTIVVRP